MILCHHKGNLIYKAIASLQKSLEVEFEIIVATSVDGLQFPGTKTLFIKGGPAQKRNVASRCASGDHIAFFDDDIEAEPYALFYLQKMISDSRIGMAFGKLLNMEHRNRFDEAGSFLTPTGFLWARAESGVIDQGQFQEAVPVLSGKSAACMVRRKVFWEVGGFDASYEILGEETDLSWRVWLYGYEVFYVPLSVTYHAFNTKFKPADFYIPKRVYFNGCRNYISMLITNLENHNLIFAGLCQVTVWTMAGLGMFFTGKFEAATYIFKGLIWVMSHWRQILAKRMIVQKNRKISDKKLMAIILKNPPISYYINRFFHYIKTGRHG